MNLDDELRSALRPREPAPGFTERILARVREPAPLPRLSWREHLAVLLSPRRLYWGTACVVTVFLLVAAGQDYRQRRQGERAKQQVMLALEVASAKLNYVQQRTLESMVNR
jgi:hypothetical protein